MSGYISPVRIDEIYYTKIGFSSADNTRGNVNVNLTVSELDAKAGHDDANERYIYTGGIEVRAVGSLDSGEEVIVAEATVKGTVSVDFGIGSFDKARDYLRLNMVSLFYGNVRSMMFSLASQSCAARFLIAPIDPAAVVDANPIDWLDAGQDVASL